MTDGVGSIKFMGYYPDESVITPHLVLHGPFQVISGGAWELLSHIG